jgi:DNA-binding NtrC family response regulator
MSYSRVVADDKTPCMVLAHEPGGGLALRVQRIRIMVVEGPDQGRDVVSEGTTVRVGSHPQNDLVLSDPTVSRQHCEISFEDNRIRIVDRGSANGTFVAAVRLRDAEIGPGSVLRVGRTSLQVSAAEDTIRIPLSMNDRFGELLGNSVKMRQLFAILERVSPTDETVLLEGESGTGKELAAEGIHAASRRADGPFVIFDCGATPRDLVESALFGHVRGAYTGAISDRSGVFEEADGGTLFLDEIGELPLDLQPKLLRALERREIRRVGETAYQPVDVRIVAATNRSLEEEVNARRFREDLYYRLAVVRITLPTLRSRPEDIPLLVNHFARQMSPDDPGVRLPDSLLASFMTQSWRGNVRELRNAVRRALSVADFSTDALRPVVPAGAATTSPSSLVQLPYPDALERFEREYFDAALREAGGNISAAARRAGVNRKLIQRLLKRHGLKAND